MSTGWSLYITILTVVNILGMLWLILWTGKKPSGGEAKEGETTGHKWDDDLEEYNNPLPRWWLWLFIITIIYAAIYLVIYPGLGSYEGTSKWSQTGQYQEEMDAANKKYGVIFAKYAEASVPELSKNTAAMDSGQRLFLTYCASCHGSDGTGTVGYPNLTDNDWLYVGSPEEIKKTIRDGRQGVMPPFGAGLPAEDLDNLITHLRGLSGQSVDQAQAAKGHVQYQNLGCAGCHGEDASGNSSAGFPNLTDNIWLHGGSPGQIKITLTEGRMNEMPKHSQILSEDKIHLLAAYVYSLSR